MIEPIPVLSSDEVYRGKRLVMVEDTLQLDAARTVVRERVKHPGAVVILPFLDDGRIAMVRQWRHAIGSELLELPAGTLEAGEVPEICARRELIEEINFKARDVESLGTLFPAPGFCDERQFLFVATGLEPAFAEADEDERIEVCPLSPSELRARIADGSLIDAKTLALCLRASLTGHLRW